MTEQTNDRRRIFYKGHKTTYDFKLFETIKVFEDAYKSGIMTIGMANDEQNQLEESLSVIPDQEIPTRKEKKKVSKIMHQS